MGREKTKIYLDTNVYNRPFDDQGQMRIRLEAEAFLSIMEKAASKSIIIIGSSALMYENSQNPFIERRERISSFLSIAATTVTLSDAIKNKYCRSKELTLWMPYILLTLRPAKRNTFLHATMTLSER